MTRGERAARGMAAIGGAVSAGAALSPRTLLRTFGMRADTNGASTFGWRLFAVRTAYLSAHAWRGDDAARRAFLPIQALDQAVFWHGAARGAIPRRTAALAASASAAIVALDLVRRAEG